jgi:hypothetical protein
MISVVNKFKNITISQGDISDHKRGKIYLMNNTPVHKKELHNFDCTLKTNTRDDKPKTRKILIETTLNR